MNDFDYDVIQRKRLAGQAKYRKCGSKSRKCFLESDRLTPKQWRERCGDVVSYQLGKPMYWAQFKQLPQDIQKIYIDGLMDRFCPTAADLSKVFGATAHTITKYLGNEFGIQFPRGKQMPKDRLLEFSQFLSRPEDTDTVPETPPEAEQVPEEPTEGLAFDTGGKPVRQSPFMMTEFSLTFDGKYDPNMVHNSIASMLPEGADVKIEIHCSIHNK